MSEVKLKYECWNKNTTFQQLGENKHEKVE